jgi:hypothetical protein
MQDNFNLAEYLRHGNKLLNENIGGYVDLRPINSLNKAPMGDDIMTLEELMGTAMEMEDDDDGFIAAQRMAAGEDDDDEEIYHADVLSPEWEERFLGLGGDAVVRGIKYLVDDGFELDDIIKFLKNNEL